MKRKGNKLGRRSFMHIGMLGGVGLSLSDYFKIKQAQADQKFYESIEGPAKSVIYIYLPGGSAHQETFDPVFISIRIQRPNVQYTDSGS